MTTWPLTRRSQHGAGKDPAREAAPSLPPSLCGCVLGRASLHQLLPMGKMASRWGSYAQLVPFSHPPTLPASLPAAPPRWLKGHYSEAHSAWVREHNSCFTGRSRQNIECPKKCPFHRLARPAWKGLFSLIVRARRRSCPRPASSPGQGASGAGKSLKRPKKKS